MPTTIAAITASAIQLERGRSVGTGSDAGRGGGAGARDPASGIVGGVSVSDDARRIPGGVGVPRAGGTCVSGSPTGGVIPGGGARSGSIGARSRPAMPATGRTTATSSKSSPRTLRKLCVAASLRKLSVGASHDSPAGRSAAAISGLDGRCSSAGYAVRRRHQLRLLALRRERLRRRAA